MDDSGGELGTRNSVGAESATECGYVEGAMKGNYPYSQWPGLKILRGTYRTLGSVIKRSRPLREAAGDSKLSSKRFQRVMKELIVRESAELIVLAALNAILTRLHLG